MTINLTIKRKILMIPSASCQMKNAEAVWRDTKRKDNRNQSFCLARKKPYFPYLKMYESNPEKIFVLEYSPAFCLLCWLPGSLTATQDKNQNWAEGKENEGCEWSRLHSVYIKRPSIKFLSTVWLVWTSKSKTV
jgi:hypothetical protein